MNETTSRRAVFEIASSLLSLAFVWIAWRLGGDADRELRLSPRWLAAGAASSLLWSRIEERNWLGIYSNWRRGAVAGGLWGLTSRRLFPDDHVATLNYALGSSIATICYRLLWPRISSQDSSTVSTSPSDSRT